MKRFKILTLAAVAAVVGVMSSGISLAADDMPNLDDIGIRREMKKEKPVDPKVWEKKPDAKPGEKAEPKPGDKKADAQSKPKSGRLTPEEAKAAMAQIKMIYIKGGCFTMGDFTGEGDDDERPAHEVCVSPYYLAESVVTEKLWSAVMGAPPKDKYEPDKPVVSISFHWTMAFLEKLNKATKKHYRLPTEAEWEFAAREGGKKIRWSGTDDDSAIGDYAWFAENSNNEVQPVKTRKPNALGLYDMTGNVYQWTNDKFDFDYYQVSPRRDPRGADASLWRTIRGGSVYETSRKSRTTYRYGMEPPMFRPDIGIRLAE